jgi:hypothetical protein
MTTIAYSRAERVLAADSRQTFHSRPIKCEKLYRRAGAVIALAGDEGPGLLFLDWYGSGRARPELLVTGEGDFEALVLDDKKRLWRFDKWCRGERIRARYFAIGTGADIALGAMEAGASARAAVRIACMHDINSGLPVRVMGV